MFQLRAIRRAVQVGQTRRLGRHLVRRIRNWIATISETEARWCA